MNRLDGHGDAHLEEGVRENLLDALRRVQLDHGRLCMDGIPVARVPSAPGALRQALPALAAALYTHWFAAWTPPGGARGGQPSNGEFFASLRAAHAAAGCFEPGWIAAGEAPLYGMVAIRNGESHTVAPGECINLFRPGDAIRRGDAIAIPARRDVAFPQEGWWMTWSSAGPAPEVAMLRLYWNCGPEAVRPLIRGLTEATGMARVRYTLKCPSSPSLFGRRDGTVLYFATRDWPALKAPLQRIHQRLGASLGEATPPMTFRLGRGAAMVEDPGNGHSFGQTISWAIASGILESLAQRNANLEDRVCLLADHLHSLGISPTRPYARTTASEIDWEPW